MAYLGQALVHFTEIRNRMVLGLISMYVCGISESAGEDKDNHSGTKT